MAIPFMSSTLVQFAVLLALGVLSVYLLRRSRSKSQVNNEQVPKAVVRKVSAGWSDSNKRPHTYVMNAVDKIEEDYQRGKKEFKEIQEKYPRGEKELIKKETLEENAGKALLHGKGDGVNKIDEKGELIKMNEKIQTEPVQSKFNDGFVRVDKIEEKVEPIKMNAEIQTEPDYRKFDDGFVRVDKIEEKGEPIKMKANIQTEADQSNFDDGFVRVDKIEEKGEPIKMNTNIQTEADQSNFNDEFVRVDEIEEKGELINMKTNIQTEPGQGKVHDGLIDQQVCDNYFQMESTEAEKETHLKEL